VLPFVHESAQAYFDWLLGGAEAARHVLQRWLQRTSSEVSLERVTLLVEREAVVGGYIALSGADLVVCRKADSLALLTEAERSSRTALAERLRAVRSLFAPVGTGEWYLSKIGVVPNERRRGLGRRLVEAYLRSGEELACERFRLDVNADNLPAIKLYESLGFRVVHDATSTESGLRYFGMEREA
jgi:ribosomal protein S18 acetylase RimI-like enzyme